MNISELSEKSSMPLTNPLTYLKFTYRQLKILAYLAKTYAPPRITFAYFSQIIGNKIIEHKYKNDLTLYREQKKQLTLSQDVFTRKIPYWLYVIDKFELRHKNIKALEIGCWEGLSSHFLLSNLSKATLTCVDTWKGSDEHANKQFELNKIEARFDNNIKQFSSRIIKHKGTSFSFFEKNPTRCLYDFIYIDGSHHCDDVVIDAVKCFEILKVGGFMIFDDYLWKEYSNDIENPASAINLFLRLKKGSYKVVRIFYQVIIQKKSDRYQPFIN